MKKAAEDADAMTAVPLSTPAMVAACLSRTKGPGIMVVEPRIDLDTDRGGLLPLIILITRK